MEPRKSARASCTICPCKYCYNRPGPKNWSTYGSDFQTPFKDAGYYNYFMATNGLLNKKHYPKPFRKNKYTDQTGMISVYLSDYRPPLPEPTIYMDNYYSGKRCEICAKREHQIIEDTTKDKFALREQLVQLYSDRFNSFQRETRERSPNAKLLKDRSYEWFSGLSTNLV